MLIESLEKLDFAESELVGTILTHHNKMLYEVSAILRPEYFSIPEMQQAYAAFMEMDAAGTTITPGSLMTHLGGNLTSDMKVAIVQACESVISPSGIKNNAKAIFDRWKLKEAQQVALDFIYDDCNDINQHIYNCSDKLTAIAGNGDEDDIKPWRQVVSDAKEKMFQPISERRLYFGMSGCDYIVGGVDPTDYIIIAARPAIGKSSYAAQIVRSFAKRGKKILLVSLEMPGQQLVERMTTAVSDIDMDAIRNRVASRGAEADIEREQIEIAAETMEGWKIDLHDKGRMTPAQLLRLVKIRRYDAVVIDHIGLMTPDGKTNTREQEVSTISRALRALAMNCQIQVFALCQLNRAVEGRSSKRVMLSDLRDSGSLEQDATHVIGLSPTEDDKILFEVLKNRNGRLGTQLLRFDKPHMTFHELEEKYSEPERRKMRGMEV